jgi:hypothetical protein
MGKTIIIGDNMLKSEALMEAIEFNQMPESLRLPILRGKTLLSNNLALPSDNFLEHECLMRFNEVSEGQNTTPDDISNIANQLSRIEKPLRNNLEELCVDEVTSLFSIPTDKVDFLIRIVDSVDQSKTNVPFGPDENFPPNYDDTDGQLKLEVDKRCMQNAIICGAALYYTRMILDGCTSRLDEFDINLYSLYQSYLSANEYLLYNNGNEMPDQNQKDITGIAIVTLGNDDMKNQLDVQAINFAVLVYETIKGFLEMTVSHGLPEDSLLMSAVISKCDYITAEPWYMRFGPFIWDHVINAIGTRVVDRRANLMPYVFMKVSQLAPNKYIKLMRETLSDSERSRVVFDRVVDYANLKFEKFDFDNRMTNYRSNAAVIIKDNKPE